MVRLPPATMRDSVGTNAVWRGLGGPQHAVGHPSFNHSQWNHSYKPPDIIESSIGLSAFVLRICVLCRSLLFCAGASCAPTDFTVHGPGTGSRVGNEIQRPDLYIPQVLGSLLAYISRLAVYELLWRVAREAHPSATNPWRRSDMRSFSKEGQVLHISTAYVESSAATVCRPMRIFGDSTVPVALGPRETSSEQTSSGSKTGRWSNAYE